MSVWDVHTSEQNWDEAEIVWRSLGANWKRIERPEQGEGMLSNLG